LSDFVTAGAAARVFFFASVYAISAKVISIAMGVLGLQDQFSPNSFCVWCFCSGF